MKQLTSEALFKPAFVVPITAASTNGAVTDTQGADRATAVFHSKPTGAGTTSDCKLQEGDASDGSDMADVTNATFTQVTTAGGEKLATMEIELGKRKRYLRLVHTGAGGAAAGAAEAAIILHRLRNAAPSQDVTVKSV